MPALHPIRSDDRPPDADAADVSAARKDSQAFARLYDRYVQPVYRYLRSRTGSADEAEDLTAQTFLEAMESLPRYDHRGYFGAWLFAIARRKAADFFRRRRNVPLEEAEAFADEADPAVSADDAIQIRKLRGLIFSLAEAERELIRLHFSAGLTFAEMGSLLGKTEDAVKKSVHRLLERLHSRME
jgi:RNA polymerase sigma-70 factor (ECF subfamily)